MEVKPLEVGTPFKIKEVKNQISLNNKLSLLWYSGKILNFVVVGSNLSSLTRRALLEPTS
eukprot:c16952_g2_i2 orf=103-282(+)